MSAKTTKAVSADLERSVDCMLEMLPRMIRLLSAGVPFKPEELDLTLGQFKVVATLPVRGSLSMRAISESLGISQPATTEAVDRLVREGLAKRHADTSDRRVVRIALTSRGRLVQSKCNLARRRGWLCLLAHLDPPQCAAMVDHLSKFLSLLEVASERREAVESRETR